MEEAHEETTPHLNLCLDNKINSNFMELNVLFLNGILTLNKNGILEEQRKLSKLRGIEVDHEQKTIKLAPILNKLADMSFQVQNKLLSYKSYCENVFIFVGKTPIEENFTINFTDLVPHDSLLVIRCRSGHQIQNLSDFLAPSQSPHDDMNIKSPALIKDLDENANQYKDQLSFPQKWMDPNQEAVPVCNSTLYQEEKTLRFQQTQLSQPDLKHVASGKQVKGRQKRSKERTIQDVVQNVNLWRKLYSGFIDKNGEFVKYSLEDAALVVNISKKTLDDYLLHVRFGKLRGFDFTKFRYAKIGVLRAFVKMLKAGSRDRNETSSKLME